MGLLRIADGSERRVHPLASSTLVGRGWPCLARFSHTAVPIYWLEVRWYAGAWAWRTLSAEARTRASGPFAGDGWRAFTAAGARGRRISLAEDAWVELIDDAPPRAFLSDVETGAVLPDDDARALGAFEVRHDAVLPLSAEGVRAHAFPDGAVVRAGGCLMRVHAPQGVLDTDGARLDLRDSDLLVEIDADATRVRFSAGDRQVDVAGAFVRVLAVYAEARNADVPLGGWLDPVEAWTGWVARGGNPESPVDRIAWERAKLRAQLSRSGVAGLDALYEVRREGDTVRVRLASMGAEIRAG